MSVRIPPPSASIAAPAQDGKLHAPAAARNVGDITKLLARVAPQNGHALEIASGTGQHIIAFAHAMPHLHWHPSDVTQERLNSIKAYIGEADLPNISTPILLNATQAGWSQTLAPKELIVLSNLLHLISAPEVDILIAQTAKALSPGGICIFYGPFTRGGELTSAGDASFDASLRASDPEIGYKDDFDIIDSAHKNGLSLVQAVEMPANNLALMFAR